MNQLCKIILPRRHSRTEFLRRRTPCLRASVAIFYLKKTLRRCAAAVILTLAFTNCERKFNDGEAMYKKACANCHMDDGSGLVGLIPPVAASDFMKNNLEKLPCLIKNGISGPISVNGKQYGGQNMPAMPSLTPVDITNLLNFLNTSFGNENPILTLQETKDQLENCSK
jgi:mono/diheme cytochrome c family protein